ncbi:hypothetical protein [Planococcus rifietoensis]|uniref:hypothetical protein n=1 Tax=Planococcus rifietoensis TaxID=200991 RepID=UPI00384D965B
MDDMQSHIYAFISELQNQQNEKELTSQEQSVFQEFLVTTNELLDDSTDFFLGVQKDLVTYSLRLTLLQVFLESIGRNIDALKALEHRYQNSASTQKAVSKISKSLKVMLQGVNQFGQKY